MRMETLEEQIAAALKVLSMSPVSGYTGFTERDVRRIARYRQLGGPADQIWHSIYTCAPEAWPMAVHESAELDALAKLGVDWWDRGELYAGLRMAHPRAVEAEALFIQAWGRELGLELSLCAIELANPIRNA